MTARLLADSRAPSLGVRKRPLIIAHSELVELAVRPNRVQRLKHRPEKEHPQMLHAVLRQQFQVAVDHVRAPVRPHIYRRVRRPVVCADVEIPIFLINAIELPGPTSSIILTLIVFAENSIPFLTVTKL